MVEEHGCDDPRENEHFTSQLLKALLMPMRVIPNNLAVNGARDTVLQLEVHLGNGVLGEDGGIGDITWIISQHSAKSAGCGED